MAGPGGFLRSVAAAGDTHHATGWIELMVGRFACYSADQCHRPVGACLLPMAGNRRTYGLNREHLFARGDAPSNHSIGARVLTDPELVDFDISRVAFDIDGGSNRSHVIAS
jgi:hypothetical protein